MINIEQKRSPTTVLRTIIESTETTFNKHINNINYGIF